METILDDCYYTRLSVIETNDVEYDNVHTVDLNNYHDRTEAKEKFNNLYKTNKFNILDYDKIIQTNKFKKNKFIIFDNKKMYDAFNIKMKEKQVPQNKNLYSLTNKKREITYSSSESDYDNDSNNDSDYESVNFDKLKNLVDDKKSFLNKPPIFGNINNKNKYTDSDSDSEPKPLPIKQNLNKKVLAKKTVVKKQENSDKNSFSSDESDDSFDKKTDKNVTIYIHEGKTNTLMNKAYKINGKSVNVTFCYNKEDYPTWLEAHRRCLSLINYKPNDKNNE